MSAGGEREFNKHVSEGRRGDEEALGRSAFKERIEKVVLNFNKREEHRGIYEAAGRCTQVNSILYRR